MKLYLVLILTTSRLLSAASSGPEHESTPPRAIHYDIKGPFNYEVHQSNFWAKKS